ncbi:MAG TPA: CHAD domain-containing protein [Allosphingosinicella sp.]
MALEVELKFDVEPGHEALLRAVPALSGPSETAAHESLYFDTKDGALRRAGFSLRVRRTAERCVQTIKRSRGSAAGLFVRQEWEADVAGFALDPALLKSGALKRLVESMPPDLLVPLIRSDFGRTAWQVRHRGSLIEVVFDEGKVRSGRMEAPISEIELELKDGKPRALFELAEEIGRSVPLRLGALSKSERGYALAERALGRAAKAEPIDLAPPLTEGEAFRIVAQSCLRHYRLNEAVLLAPAAPAVSATSRDPDALHQARIALRRLRSALSLFRPTVRGKDYGPIRDEIGWLAGQFGEARNLDVLLAGQAGRVASEDDELLTERLLKARAKAYDRVDAALHSERVRALMLRLTLWIEIGPWRFRDRADHDLAPLAIQQFDRQWRRIRRNGHKLGKLDPQTRHSLRLDVKKLRYTAEFLAGLSAKKPKAAQRDRFIAALRDLQERLGDLNDEEAAEAMTARLAPGLRGSADRIRRRAVAGESIAAAEEALARAAVDAGYWN